MTYKIFTPAALRIYQNGLSSLLKRDWLFSTFRENLKWRISRNETPNGLFFKTLHEGVLNILGSIFFDHMFAINDDVLFCDAKEAFDRSSDIFLMLIKSGCPDSDVLLDLLLAIDEVYCLLMETPEKRVNSVFHRQGTHFELQDALLAVSEHYRTDIKALRNMYGKNFAEHILHDRQICEYISFSLTEMYQKKGVSCLRLEWASNHKLSKATKMAIMGIANLAI